jgi:hypothetical protein
MVPELPPPLPPLPPAPADVPVPLEPLAMPGGEWGYAERSPARYITPAWRAVLTIGWLAVMAGVASFANSGYLVSASPFWLETPVLAILPFIVPVVAVFALMRDWRHSLFVSLGGAVSLAVIGVIDMLWGSRPVGKGEVVLAIGAALLTAAGLAGRVPRSAS